MKILSCYICGDIVPAPLDDVEMCSFCFSGVSTDDPCFYRPLPPAPPASPREWCDRCSADTPHNTRLGGCDVCAEAPAAPAPAPTPAPTAAAPPARGWCNQCCTTTVGRPHTDGGFQCEQCGCDYQ
jgi:hypothetical protein